MGGRRLVRLIAGIAAFAAASAASGQAVLVSGLSDIGFGTITSFGADRTQSQSICAYSGLLGGRYTVAATGSGAAGAFTLANGAARLPYEVQWSTSSGQTSGTNLSPGVPLGGQTMLLSCPILQTTNASLTVVLRAAALSSATAGAYTGTLTIILSAN